ncbi:MAG: hypothetical protein ACP5DQ_00600 [Bacteroidales bacterium]
MKNLTKVFLIAILVAFATESFAQVNFGVKAGLNLANVYGDDVDDSEIKIGAQVGLAVDFAFSDAMSLQTGLLFFKKDLKNLMEIIQLN